MAADGIPDLAYRLGPWLAAKAREKQGVQPLHIAFCKELVEQGLPLWRSTLGLEILHPEQGGAQFVWTAEGTEIRRANRANVAASPEYLNSPVRVADETGKPYRRRLTEAVADMPLLEELRLNGATDYIIFPLPFLDTTRTETISFATKQAGGFTEQQLIELEWAGIMLSPYAERYVLRRISIDLLDTYVGRRSGERVYNGAIERGTAEQIEAAILMADIRGFTRFSDAQPMDAVIAILNDFFEGVVGAIEAAGGEVLKFIGDGLLAIFPAQDGNLSPACKSALAAAREAVAKLESLNQLRLADGRSAIAAGYALHAGEIAYGNIGGRLRLDFTAIGPAVNHTSRLLELAKQLNATVVISSAFRQECESDLPELGEYALRDVVLLQRIFTLPASGGSPSSASDRTSDPSGSSAPE